MSATEKKTTTMAHETEDYAVTGSNGKTYRESELRRAFESVQDLAHWKNAIDAEIRGTVETIEMVSQSVIHYTGSVPSIEILEHGPMTMRVRVRAAGYYATIGA